MSFLHPFGTSSDILLSEQKFKIFVKVIIEAAWRKRSRQLFLHSIYLNTEARVNIETEIGKMEIKAGHKV